MTDMSAQDLPGVGPDLSDKLAQIGVHTVLDVRLSSKDALQRACGTTKGEALPVLSPCCPHILHLRGLTRAWRPTALPQPFSSIPACVQISMLGVRLRSNHDARQAACRAIEDGRLH